MFLQRTKSVIAAFACLALWAGLTSTAQALLVTTTGTTSGGSVSGSADFKIVGSTLEITLKNTSAAISNVAEVLDGLSFTLVGGSGVSLVGVIPNVGGGAGTFKFEDCTGASCVGTNTWVDHENNPCQPPFSDALFCWTYGAGLLAPSGGSFKPSGIVNGNFVSPNGSITGGEHNDFLNGPVEFDFTFATAPTGVSGVSFWWGTGSESTPGTPGCTTAPCVLQESAPEPGSIALVGLALSGLAWARRRFRS